MEIQHTIDIEELQPVIEGCRIPGMMLYGKATLVSADPSEKYAFYVKEVVIDGNFRLTASGAGVMGFPSAFRKLLFKAICDEIEDSRTAMGKWAQSEFSEAVDEGRDGDPDRAYDERRDAAFDFRGEPAAITTARRPDMSRKSRESANV